MFESIVVDIENKKKTTLGRVLYKNGKLEGKYKLWYENGQLWEECIYKDDNLMKSVCSLHSPQVICICNLYFIF